MNTSPAKMWVLVGEQFACVKVSGRANFATSIDFKTLMNELRLKGYSYFVLDLSECSLMDSTFLGILAGLGLKTGTGQPGQSQPAIELLNPNERVTELLENLGVLHLFKLNQGPLSMPADTHTLGHTPATPSKEELTRASLEAHKTLMEINPENVSRFKEVTAFLAEDLKKLKANPGQS